MHVEWIGNDRRSRALVVAAQGLDQGAVFSHFSADRPARSDDPPATARPPGPSRRPTGETRGCSPPRRERCCRRWHLDRGSRPPRGAVILHATIKAVCLHARCSIIPCSPNIVLTKVLNASLPLFSGQRKLFNKLSYADPRLRANGLYQPNQPRLLRLSSCVPSVMPGIDAGSGKGCTLWLSNLISASAGSTIRALDPSGRWISIVEDHAKVILVIPTDVITPAAAEQRTKERRWSLRSSSESIGRP